MNQDHPNNSGKDSPRDRFASNGYASRRSQPQVQASRSPLFGYAATPTAVPQPQQFAMPQPQVQPPQQQPQPFQQATQPVIAIPQQAVPVVLQPQHPTRNYRKVDSSHQNKMLSTIMKATVEVDRVTRQSVQRVKHSFEPPYISAMRSKRQKMLVKGYYAFGMLSFAAAITFGSMFALHSNQRTQLTNSVLGAQTSSQDLNAELVPSTDDLKSYSAEPQHPRYLRISSLNIWSRIRVMQPTDPDYVPAPSGVFDVGWYALSDKPGSTTGTAVMVAHVAGATSHGVFWDLNKMTVGTTFEIEKGSGEIIRYKVKKVGKISPSELDGKKLVANRNQSSHEIKLITANDTFDRATGAYADPFMVVAERTSD